MSAGLPVDDILMIDGVESLTPIYNNITGQFEYETAVSTLTGLDKVVAMIRENPDLADVITFNVMFDFEAMDGMYTPSEYAQYGVVQHQYEDEEGNFVSSIYPYSLVSGTYMGYVSTTYSHVGTTELVNKRVEHMKEILN